VKEERLKWQGLSLAACSIPSVSPGFTLFTNDLVTKIGQVLLHPYCIDVGFKRWLTHVKGNFFEMHCL
jgi:hypothetical protein